MAKPNLASANAARWSKAKLTRSDFNAVAKRLVAGKARFQGLEARTGVPWYVIAVIKQRESGNDPKWLGNIANGQPWSRKTTIVPKGRGPFASWEDAAYDALRNCHPYAAKNKDWSVGGTLALLEKYNGLGYANMGLPSPYIWSGTDQYVKGKYVRDHVFDENAVDKQLGCAGLIMAMQAIDKSIAFGSARGRTTPPAPSVVTVDAPVTTEQPGIWNTLWRALRGKDAKVATVLAKERPGLHATGDAALYDQQAMLSDKGYVEVGQPDGLMGGRTKTAIRAFRAENGLPPGDAIDAAFTAALTAAGPRQVAKARVETSATDLRENGNGQVATLDSLGWLGKALGLGGILGGLEQSGMLTKATDTLQTAQDTLGTVTTILTTIIGMAQWCFAHWWLFAIGGGLYVLFKVASGILHVVVLFRQGFLARADK